MKLQPYLCGVWDGCHLWAQWTPVDGVTYLFQWRWRKPGRDWSAWQSVSRPGGLQRAWLVLPIWRDGHEVQARVATVAAMGEPSWELAQEVTFLKSRCRFSVESLRKDLLLFKGTTWHCVVDGGAVSYALTGDVVVKAGETHEVEAESLASSGYAQLDKAGDFRIVPELGITIENTGPSENDVQETGRDFATMAGTPPGPVHVVFRRGHSVM